MRDTVGIVFDIEEFAVYDGPGIRMAVFLKGCPLRCEWCHNPEGLKPRAERTVTKSLCVNCGECMKACPQAAQGIEVGPPPRPRHCVVCGKCVAVCPRRAIQIAGTPMKASDVAARIRRNASILQMNEGGVTFSGGEALMQHAFVEDVCDRLPGVHKAIETSGYASEEVFLSVVNRLDLVMMDIKLVDSAAHKRYTGVPNERILSNLRALIRSGKPFRARVPVIPGVNDSDENLEATARLVADAPNLDRVELLRYNRSAGAKYGLLGEEYRPSFDTEREPNMNLAIFEKYGIKAVAL